MSTLLPLLCLVAIICNTTITFAIILGNNKILKSPDHCTDPNWPSYYRRGDE